MDGMVEDDLEEVFTLIKRSRGISFWWVIMLFVAPKGFIETIFIGESSETHRRGKNLFPSNPSVAAGGKAGRMHPDQTSTEEG